MMTFEDNAATSSALWPWTGRSSICLVSKVSPRLASSVDMGGVLAEHLAKLGERVTYVTPAGHASAWTLMTNEQPQIHRALAGAGVELKTLSHVTGFVAGSVSLANLFTGREEHMSCKSLVIVGARLGGSELYDAMLNRRDDWQSAGVTSVDCIGDALAPGAIAHAVHSGHRFARELDQATDQLIYRRDSPILESEPLLYDVGHPS